MGSESAHWWQRGVIYQIYPRSFRDTSGDGIGDLAGIVEKLDYLNDGTGESLGVDAIWISPFYPSPMADAGYDISDYCDVDPTYGTLETFDRLVQEAHRRNIKVIVDYVPNHTSDEHPWFIESRSSRDNPRHDWYIWRDPAPDGGLPNNWGSMFGGEAWTWDDTRQQYYFHQFHPKQPDLNWRNPEVRAAMMDVLRFWLDRGVDGFRMDVVYVIWKHPDMPDQPFVSGSAGRGERDIFGRQQHLYDMNYEGIHEIMKQFRALLDEYGDKVAIGEFWLPLEERIHYYGENNDEFHLPFNFDFIEEHMRNTWDADFFRTRVERYEAMLPPGCWPNYVLGNHDIPRLATRYGEQQARVAAMMLLTLRGTPTLYMGDELGLPNGHIEPHQIQDPQGKILGIEHTRDVSRTPMLWDTGPYAGFSHTDPWLPVHPDYRQRCMETQRSDPRSIFNLYRRLLWIRKQSDALSIGRYLGLESPENTYVYLRQHGDENMLIALNFTSQPQKIDLPGPGEVLLSTSMSRSGHVAGELQLHAHEGVLVSLD